jgi:hypothetical protein
MVPHLLGSVIRSFVPMHVGPFLGADMSRNKEEIVDQLPNPKVLCVACLNPC